MSLPADITARGEPERIVRAVVEAHGRLDVLVNNAGVVHSGAPGTPRQELITAQLLPRRLEAALREQTGGRIRPVAPTSTRRLTGGPGRPPP
ncbi:SDR family NAD(P)-dependent oxidoreductase [Streptomyces chryseus]